MANAFDEALVGNDISIECVLVAIGCGGDGDEVTDEDSLGHAL